MAILVAEDTPVNAILLRNILERAGHRVVLAKDGVEALEAVEQNPAIALAAVDVRMPRMNGLEFVRALRDRPDTADLPVVFITSSSEAEVVREAVALKSAGYILKPIVEPSRVLQQIGDALADAPKVLVAQEEQCRRLGVGVRTYRVQLDALEEQLAAIRPEVEGGSADPSRLGELRENAEKLGAERLARRLAGSPEPTSILREIDALRAEIAQRSSGR